MNVSDALLKMVQCSAGNRHDIDHFLKVYAYARTIAEGEGVPPEVRRTVELAAVVHDIACPLCREKYGSADGKRQEQEGPALTIPFLKGSGLPQACVGRVVYLVGHHHTPEKVDGPDYQILLEADYLVNADEGGYTREHIEQTLEKMFKTETGKALLRSIYLKN